MRIPRSAVLWAFSGLGLGAIVLLSGCEGGGGGSGGAKFVPNDTPVPKVNGVSPSEAFHKNDRRK